MFHFNARLVNTMERARLLPAALDDAGTIVRCAMVRPHSSAVTSLFAVHVLVSLVLGTGCSMSKFAADQAGGIAAQTSGYMRGFWDYDIARHGTASAIMQLEAMHAVSPDNESLTLTLASTYIGYGVGWVEYD